MHVLDVSRFGVITNMENETEVPSEPCSNYSNPWPDAVRRSDDDVFGKQHCDHSLWKNRVT